MPRKTSLSGSSSTNPDLNDKMMINNNNNNTSKNNNGSGNDHPLDTNNSRRNTRNRSNSTHQRHQLLDRDRDSIMGEDNGFPQSGNNNSNVRLSQNFEDQQQQKQEEEGEDEEEEEEEAESLRRLSETYRKSRSASSYLMDRSDDHDVDGNIPSIIVNPSPDEDDSDNSFNYDSEGDDLMQSVEGTLDRPTSSSRHHHRHTNDDDDDDDDDDDNSEENEGEGAEAFALSDEDFLDEMLGGPRHNRRLRRRHDDHQENEDDFGDEDDEQGGGDNNNDYDEVDEEEDVDEEVVRHGAAGNASSSSSHLHNASLMGSTLADSIGRLFPEAMGGFFNATGGGMGSLGGSLSISNLVDGLKRRDDPYLILETLNELSEKILMMNGVVAERSLPVYKLSQNLIDILQDPMLQEDLELQLVTCRCMYNVLAVNYDFANEMVSCGAIELLQSKLLEISFIDLAEQLLQTLEMISHVRGRDLMNKNCIHSVLEYLDFFTIHSQRKALIITANACYNIGADNSDKVKEIFPIIERVAIEYSDPISVENAWVAISRIMLSFRRDPQLLEELISSKLLQRLALILPASCGKRNSSNNLLTFATCLKILESLMTMANVSSNLSMMILDDFKLGDVIALSLGNYSNVVSSSSSDLSFNSNNPDQLQITDSSKISIEALMALPKELILSFIKLIGITLPFVKAPPETRNMYEITIGGFMSLMYYEDANIIREEKIKLYHEKSEIITIYVEKILPLLISTYSSTVDYEIRRIVLVDLFRIIDMVCDKVPLSLVLNSNITNLLASIVFQSKNFIRRELSMLRGDEEKIRSLLSKSSSGCHLYILLMGAFLITRRLSKNLDYMSEFEREGLLDDTAALLDSLKEDGKSVIDFQKEQRLKSFNGSRNPFDSHDNSGNDDDDDDDEEEEEEEEDDEDEDEEMPSQIIDDEGAAEDDENEDDDEEEEGDDNEERSGGTDGITTSLRRMTRPRSHNRPYDDNAFFYDSLSIVSLADILTELINIATDIQEQHSYFKENGPNDRLEHMQLLDEVAEKISDLDKVLKLTYAEWLEIWKLFANALGGTINKNNTISSFELISSGVIEILLLLFRSEVGYEGGPCYVSFQKIFCEMFSTNADQTELPVILLVYRLQDALTRSETFEITTSGLSGTSSYVSVYGGYSDSNNSRASVMAKQIRLRLDCNDNSMPEGSRQMIMTVHALGTFQGIHTFLKTRVQTLSLFSRLGELATRRGGSGSDIISEESTQDDGRNYYIEFLIDDEVIPDGTTIYGAVYRSLQKDSNHPVDPRLIWSGTHEIKFHKVYGDKPSENDNEEWYPHDTSIDELEVLRDATTINILDLLKILFDMNRNLKTSSGVSAALFINFKLTAKLNRQLEEPLVVSSGTLPGWSIYITRNFPFLFPIETRMFFLQSTSFGHSRLIQLWDHRTTAGSASGNQNQSSSSSSNLASLGRPSRHKIRIARKKLFECALKILKNYASIPSLIEIEYFEEEGTGLGPTLEFYANTSREFSRKKRLMWREDDDSSNKFVNYKTGLFPAPMVNGDNKVETANLTSFYLLGSFIARALLDSRIIDFNFNPLFFEIAKKVSNPEEYEDNDDININNNNRYSMLQDVKLVDPDLYKSLKHLLKYVEQYSDTINNDEVLVDDCTLEDLSLSFTLPGYQNIELIPKGHDIAVDASNIETYIDDVIDLTVGRGVRSQIESFTKGFSKVFPYSSMTIFSPEELVTLFGNDDEDWSFEVLQSSIRADHGYNNDSKAIKNLLEIMVEFNKDERRKFLQFLTGSPRLPIGGFKSLRPDLTVVRKHSEDGLTADNYLPSVMTCANYLKIPDYSTKEVMKQRIMQAINEGSDSFLLS